MAILLTLLVSAWVSYAYARIPIDPDWALFNLPAFCASWPGRDFDDCKSHGIYFWYLALAGIVGADVFRVRFAHHFIIGAGGGLAAWALTGNPWSALAFACIVNSGWMWAFHGNVGQVPAAFLLGALALPGQWAPMACLALAVLVEPKLALSAILMVAIQGWWVPAAVMGGAGLLALAGLAWVRPLWFAWIVEMNVLTPARMHSGRRSGRASSAYAYKDFAPWFTAQAFLFLLPWVVAAAWARPDLAYWAPAIVYVLLVGYGRVIRSLHLFPLAAWVAMAQPDPAWVVALTAVDMVSGGLYVGEIWLRFYGALDQTVKEARQVGEWLRGRPGIVWVNSLATEVYLWARKPVLYYMTEQVEMRDESPRRAEMRRRWKENPPDWVVLGPYPGHIFRPVKYKLVQKIGQFSVLQKE